MIDKDTVLTPKWLFDELGLVFDLDPAHPPFETHVPCRKYYTIEDDGLVQDWEGLVWLNPPYSKPAPWVDKWLNHANGLMLVQYSRGKWFKNLFESKAAQFCVDHVKAGGFKFEKDGKPHGIFMPVALWAIGYEATKALGKLQGRIR